MTGPAWDRVAVELTVLREAEAAARAAAGALAGVASASAGTWSAAVTNLAGWQCGEVLAATAGRWQRHLASQAEEVRAVGANLAGTAQNYAESDRNAHVALTGPGRRAF